MQKGKKSSESKERKGLGWLCGGGLGSNAEAKLRNNHKKLLFRKGGCPGKVSLRLINMHACCHGDLWVSVYVFKLTSVRMCQ